TARLAERFPDAEIEDVRERIGLQVGEDPNQAVMRRQSMTVEHLEQPQVADTEIEHKQAPQTQREQEIQREQEREVETQSRGRSM
ncbi:MAG: hypothetical protein HY309_19115, partial [Pseudomonas fluorescens]|nr:hypothetical protein [Pseudomonas fluorescens]